MAIVIKSLEIPVCLKKNKNTNIIRQDARYAWMLALVKCSNTIIVLSVYILSANERKSQEILFKVKKNAYSR